MINTRQIVRITPNKKCFISPDMCSLYIFWNRSLSSFCLPFSYPEHLLMKTDIYILFFFKEYLKVCIFPGYFKKYLVKYMEKAGPGYQMTRVKITLNQLFSAKRGILNHLLMWKLSRDNIPTEADLLWLRGSFFKRD